MAENKFNEFKELLESLEGDFAKFYEKGVGTAGTRVRKGLQALAVLCKETRKDITEVKTARKEAK